MKNVTILRAHHLLCAVLFQGKGYSEGFTANMTQVVHQMRSGEGSFCLVSEQDAVCAGCPNRLENGGCALDYEQTDENGIVKETAETQIPIQVGRTIEQLDQRLAALTGLELGGTETASARKLMSYMKEHVTEAVFNDICGECRWKKQGICSFQRYSRELEKFITGGKDSDRTPQEQRMKGK